MRADFRIDLPSSRSDGPNYGNGHRAPYTISALEKSGSFREGSDRIFSSPHNISKFSSTTSQDDMTCLLQSLASDLKGVAPDPKLNRPGEMKRAMSSIFGAPTENSSASTFETKQFPSSSLEGMRRLKNNLQESSSKASHGNRFFAVWEYGKTFDAACSMIDKFWQQKRKRSRIGQSSNVRTTGLYQGGNILKTGLQSFASGSGLEMPEREEKSKVEVPNKRSRTSPLETNGTARASSLLERDKDAVKFISGSTTHLVENDGAFSPVADGWERSKLKKKRSAIKSDTSGSRLSRSQGAEREAKRGMQHKLGIDARPRISHAHSFRPGSDRSAVMVGNLDTSPQHASSMRFRNELNNGSLQNDKRDVRFCPETESASVKVITKPTSREDRSAASPSFLKFGSLRTRTNPGALPKRSANVLRVMGNPEDMEQPQATEKLNALGVNNRKRAASATSSSPPVGHWAVQRPKKFSRSSRRSSLSPLFSSHDEFSVSEPLDDVSIHHDSLGEARHTSLNASQQCKIRGDNSLASASLSESEESGFQVNKVKCKVNKCREMEDKSGQTVHKSSNFIMASRKNMMTVEEDSGDGDCREGRTGRGIAPTRSGLAARVEKLGEAVTAKQQRSVRHGSERVESKTDRQHIKKVSERKSYTRPKQSINVLSMESSEEAFDDHDELVAAATAAVDTGRACSSSFWKQLEPVFSFVSSEDIAFLREQIQLTDESAARTHVDEDNFQKLKVDLELVPMSSGPVGTNAWKSTSLSDGISSYECDREGGFMKDTGHTGPLSNSGVSLCQTLLSAIIGEEDIENICSTVDYGEGYSFEDCNDTQFELEKGLKSKVLNLQLQGDSQFARTSDCYKVDEDWRFPYLTSTERSGTNGIMETYSKTSSNFQLTPKQLVPKQTTPSNGACTVFQYNQMNINDRLIVELSEIGIHPEVESVPDLKYGEHEDITESIHMLEEKLKEQAANRKGLLLKLEKAAMDAKEQQQSEVELLAMDRLVERAYDRYKACGRPGTSGSRNVSKVAKNANMAFVKRTLARLDKFEETGVSCFDQPIFRDMFSASSHCSNSQSMDISANDHNAVTNSQITGKADLHEKYSSAALPHPFREGEPGSNRLKKREVSLDDVAGSSFPSSRTPVPGTSMVSSAKGKRSERDRDGKGHNRGSLSKNGTPKVGRPASSGSLKAEMKCKSKPKTKTTQSSTSANVLHGKNTETSAAGSPLPPKSSGFGARDGEKNDNLCSLPDSGIKKFSNSGEAVDSSNLPLDVFEGQGQDIASWLNFDDEGLQDNGDYVGLEIPMDDLSDVHMMI
ncbi:uncharacterized protein LOC110026560 [Phalaenopsis equestris]|uniref:uncharacterized protein LOC110026560 n=1 Tax=Phalaenopsis equestris TaxID=78828 RepID=UPI0009E58F1B|nr:uncharacterized protein LOC110026560 [Phalaenopsis equestris]